MEKEKMIDVLWNTGWEKYTVEEVKEAFNFSVEPDYQRITEIIVEEGGNGWIKVTFETDEYPFLDVVIYDKVYSSYVESNC